MQVIEIIETKQVALFHSVLERVYRDDKQFIFPIEDDVEAVFDKNKNKSFQRGNIRRWVLLGSDGLLAGRIAAFYFQKSQSGKRGGIGFFDCVDNTEYATTLWDVAEQYLKEERCEFIDAPINFGDRDSFWGLLIRSQTPISYKENYNPPYYQKWIESRGYSVEIVQNTYEITNEKFNYKRFRTIADRVMQKPNYRFVFLEYGQIATFAKDFVSIYNEAWAFHEDFAPLESGILQKRLNEIKPAMPKEFAVFAYDNEKPIGFFIAILELNQVFSRFKGKMGALQKMQFLLNRKNIDKGKAIVFGIVPSHQNLGIETGLIMKFHEGVMQSNRIHTLELAWIGDFNPKMISMLEAVGAQKTKIHHTYRKEIAEGI